MIKRITLMIKVEDTARADIALTPERSYYRFATDSSIEDGELAAVADFQATAESIIAAAKPLNNETPLSDDVKLQLFVDNVLNREAPSEQSLSRIISIADGLFPEFSFLNGFKQ